MRPSKLPQTRTQAPAWAAHFVSPVRLGLGAGSSVVVLAGLVGLGLALAVPSRAQAEGANQLTFDQLLARAARGPQARAAHQRTMAARGAQQQAAGARLPLLQLSGLLAPSPEIRCSDPDCTRTDPREVGLAFDGAMGSIEVAVVQPLYTFGKLAAASRASTRAVAARRFQEDALLGDLSVEVARAYYGVKLARELAWMLEDGAEQIEKALVRIRDQLAAGQGEATVQDRLRLEVLAAEVGARLTEAREAEGVALAGVRALADDDRTDVDDGELTPRELDLAGENAYVARARQGRPEVRAAAAGADVSDQLARLQQARWFPDLVLFGGVRAGRAQGVDDPPTAFANDPFNATSAAVAVGVRWALAPLAHRGVVAQANAEARGAQALAEAVVKGAEFEARAAFVRAREAQQRLQAARQAERGARAWVAATLQAEGVGTVDSKDLADAYLAYFASRARVLQTMFEWNVAVVGLGRATGEYRRPH
jgi:outer membrane protein TolC